MNILQERLEMISQIINRHLQLLSFYDDISGFENMINVIPKAFSAKSHYNVVYTKMLQNIKYVPFFCQDDLTMYMDPDALTLKTIFGFSLLLSADDDSNIFADGYNSTEAAENILILKATANCDYFFDVGANIGYYSFLIAQSRQQEVTIFAFEPVSNNFAKLSKGIEINQYQQIVKPLKVAVGAQNQPEIDIHINRYGSGGNSILPFSDARMGSDFSEKAPLISLDQFLEQNKIYPNNSFLKIDVEGFEEEVIKGAKGFLTSSRPPIILIETFPKRNADIRVLSQLSKWGYEVWGVGSPLEFESSIYPAFRYGRLRRSPNGNYMAFHTTHKAILNLCKQPITKEIFFSEDRIGEVIKFQARTIKSLDEYIQRLVNEKRNKIIETQIDIPSIKNDNQQKEIITASFSPIRRFVRRFRPVYHPVLVLLNLINKKIRAIMGSHL